VVLPEKAEISLPFLFELLLRAKELFQAAMSTGSHSILLITLAAFCSMVSMRISDPLLPIIAAEFQTTSD